MKIYNVRFNLLYNQEFIKERISENNNKRSLEEQIDVDEIEIDDEDNDNSFQVGATNLADAFLEGQDYLEDVFGEDDAIEDWEITGVQLIDLNVVNWPEKDCTCVSCLTERAAPEDCLNFEHTCSEKIEVAAEGWSEFTCPKCHEQILRDCIIGSNGHYLYVNINKEKDDGKKS